MTGYLVAIGIVGVSFVGSLVAPRLFIYVVIASLMTDVRLGNTEVEGGVSFSIQELAMYGFAIAFLMRRFPMRDIILKDGISKTILLYSSVMIISTIPNFGEGPSHMLSVIRDTLVPVFWFIIFVNFLLYSESGDGKRYYIFFIILGLVSAGVGFIQHFLHQFIILDRTLNRDYLSLMTEGQIGEANPSTGLFSWFNAYGMFIQMTLLISLVNANYVEYRKKFLYFAAGVILVIAMYFSFSRGTYLSFVVAMVTALIVGTRRFKYAAYIAGASVVGVIVFYVLPFFLNDPAQLATLFSRFAIWGYGYSYFVARSNWIYGMGPGMFITLVGTLYDVHNEYLMHLFENGLLGLSVLLLLIFVLVRSSYQLYKRATTRTFQIYGLANFIIFVGFFTQEFVEHTFYSVIFRSIIFTLAAFIIKARKEMAAAQ